MRFFTAIAALSLVACGANAPLAPAAQDEESSPQPVAAEPAVANAPTPVDPPPAEDAPEPDYLVVFIEVRAPHEDNQASVIQVLQNEGFEADAESPQEVLLMIERSVFVERFHAVVGSVRTGASASDRIIEIETLESYRVPASLRRFVHSVYFDPQR